MLLKFESWILERRDRVQKLLKQGFRVIAIDDNTVVFWSLKP